MECSRGDPFVLLRPTPTFESPFATVLLSTIGITFLSLVPATAFIARTAVRGTRTPATTVGPPRAAFHAFVAVSRAAPVLTESAVLAFSASATVISPARWARAIAVALDAPDSARAFAVAAPI